MLYREVKSNGDELSILGFGCMRLPQKKGTPGDGKIYEEQKAEQSPQLPFNDKIQELFIAVLMYPKLKLLAKIRQ